MQSVKEAAAARFEEILSSSELRDLAMCCALSMIAFALIVLTLSYLGIFGYVGVTVYFLLLLAVLLWSAAELFVQLVERMEWDKVDNLFGEMCGTFNRMVKACRSEAWSALFHNDYRATIFLWFGPAFVSAYGLFSQMWLLHVATYYYVMSMDRLEMTLDDVATQGGSRGHNFSRFHGPFGELTPGVNNTEVSFGSNPDVIEAMMSYQDVSIGLLDKVAAAMPLAFVGLAIARNELAIWSKAMFSNAILAVLKGSIGAMTIVPDSAGWQTCQARLGDESVHFFREELPNPFKDGVLSNILQIMRAEVDGMHHNRILSGIRWCADMMFSGHTYFTFLYSVALLEVLSRWYAKTQSIVTLLCCGTMTVVVVSSQFMELYLVLHNRFHYTSDVFVAVLMVLLIYSNGPMAILAHWWSFELRACEEHDDHARLVEERRLPLLWVPPLCCPLCCLPKMVGFHTLQFEREDHVLEQEMLYEAFGESLRVKKYVCGCERVLAGVIVGVDVGVANNPAPDGTDSSDVDASEVRYEVVGYYEDAEMRPRRLSMLPSRAEPRRFDSFMVKESELNAVQQPSDDNARSVIQSKVFEFMEDQNFAKEVGWSELRKQKTLSRLRYRRTRAAGKRGAIASDV